MLKVCLERNSTIAHTHLPEFFHLSLGLTPEERRIRGRGDFSEVVLQGNGLGRLLSHVGLGKFWAPTVLFPPDKKYSLRNRS